MQIKWSEINFRSAKIGMQRMRIVIKMGKFKSRFTLSVTERGGERLQTGQMHARGERCKEEKESVVNRKSVNKYLFLRANAC